MAVYKVPQDVEAEDKLIGPFSFRQFIYLIIVAISCFVAFILFQAFPVLVVIPLPVILLFGALALPLRKDQPMETYLLAIIRFYLKPKRRMWDPEGAASHIEITMPASQERSLIKDFDQDTAQQRLDYLARVMDSRGWSLKGVNRSNESVSDGVAAEAANAFDIMDDHAELAKSFDSLLAKKNESSRQEVMERMKQTGVPARAAAATSTPAAPAQPGSVAHQDYANNPYDDVLARQFPAGQPAAAAVAPTPPAPAADDNTPAPRFNPYPTAIHQKVVSPYHVPEPTSSPLQPLQKAEEPKPAKPLTQTVSPDIIRLARNNDLSISAIAHEAHRLQDGDEGEVVIKLH